MATHSDSLALAIEHHRNGRLREAEQVYRRILAVEPNEAGAWHLLGVVALQAGQHAIAVDHIERAIALNGADAAAHNNLGEAYRSLFRLPEAVASYQRALELKPDFAEVHNNLGNALKDQEKLDEAIAAYRRALELKPEYAEAHYNLANALREEANLDEAVACYRRALDLKPDYSEAHNNLGNVLSEQGKLAEAVACFRRAIDLKPDYAETHNNLGNVLRRQGKLAEAVACYRLALRWKPDFAKAEYHLGNALREQGKLDEAAGSYRRALQRMPDDADIHNNLGGVLLEQGKLDEAVVCYRHVLQLKPDFAEAHGNLGAALEQLGNLQDAENSFRAALRHNPRFALAHYNLANLLGGDLPNADLTAIRGLFADVELSDAQRMLLHFGLARVLDGRGEYSAASEHLEPANSLQLAEWRKSGREYDPMEFASLVNQSISICTPDFFERLRSFGLETEAPVFVLGLPRSGTTLVEQILASHSRVFGAGEIKLAHDSMNALSGQNPDRFEGLRGLNGPTARSLATWHFGRLRRLNRDALRIVDKMPDNYSFLGLLAILFPRAKIIHCRRDLRDVVLSCWMTFFKEINWANDHKHISSRFHEHARIMDHWHKVLPVPMLEVDYEETVADLEGVARKLVAWCGLEWEPACLEFHRTKRMVRTASAVQVRQPVFKTSVARWRHYEQYLAPLFSRL